jgi:hypothetical protein
MNAGEAFILMKQGKRITRTDAGNPNEYFRIHNNLLLCWDGASQQEIIIDGVYTDAIMSEDWIEQKSDKFPLYYTKPPAPASGK